jgi:galactosyl transferase GMA12/MNN10 family
MIFCVVYFALLLLQSVYILGDSDVESLQRREEQFRLKLAEAEHRKDQNVGELSKEWSPPPVDKELASHNASSSLSSPPLIDIERRQEQIQSKLNQLEEELRGDEASSRRRRHWGNVTIFQVWEAPQTNIKAHEKHTRCVTEYARRQNYTLVRHDNDPSVRARMKENGLMFDKKNRYIKVSAIEQDLANMASGGWLLYVDLNVCFVDAAKRIEQQFDEALDALDAIFANQTWRSAPLKAREACSLLYQDYTGSLNTGMLMVRNDEVARGILRLWIQCGRTVGAKKKFPLGIRVPSTASCTSCSGLTRSSASRPNCCATRHVACRLATPTLFAPSARGRST